MSGEHPTQNPGAAELTSALVGAGSAVTLAAGALGESPIAITLGLVGLLVALYEFIALATDKVPTITDTLTKNGLVVRVGAIVLGVLAWIDHLGPGWIL